jgi:hypothetical protein
MSHLLFGLVVGAGIGIIAHREGSARLGHQNVRTW